MPRWSGLSAPLGFLFLCWSPARAGAIPLFAHQYGVTCAKCHSAIPHLNEFGAAFLADGERLPGVSAGPAFPISIKINLVASSENQGEGPDGAGLPKAIVDEIELFTSDTIGSRANYFVEQYVVDGGEPGLLRDAWVNDRVNPWSSRVPVQVQAGQFTLPLPVDPETFRDTYQGYTPYEQAVGANPFTFFAPKLGMRVGVGNPLRGLSGQLFAGPGYDQQSGLATTGVDTETYVQDAAGPLSFTAFRYDGTRPVAGGPNDSFWRNGYGLTYGQWSRFSSEFVLIQGNDSNCGAPPFGGCISSGGFEQLRYAFSRRLFTEARYEGTDDPTSGFARDGVVLLGYAPVENARVTAEEVFASQGDTFNAQVTVAF